MPERYEEARRGITGRARLAAVPLVLLLLLGAPLVGVPGWAYGPLLAVILVGGIFIYGVRRGGAALDGRRAEVGALAEEHGFAFEPVPGVADGALYLGSLSEFDLFSRYRGKAGNAPDREADERAARVMDRLGTLDIVNRVRGSTGGYQFEAFDYRNSAVSEGRGKRGARRTTVFVLTLPSANLPSLRLFPQNVAGRAGRMLSTLSRSRRSLAQHPGLDALFILYADDEGAAARLLGSTRRVAELQGLGERFGDVVLELSGSRLLLYKAEGLPAPPEYRDLLQAAERVADTLTGP